MCFLLLSVPFRPSVGSSVTWGGCSMGWILLTDREHVDGRPCLTLFDDVATFWGRELPWDLPNDRPFFLSWEQEDADTWVFCTISSMLSDDEGVSDENRSPRPGFRPVEFWRLVTLFSGGGSGLGIWGIFLCFDLIFKFRDRIAAWPFLTVTFLVPSDGGGVTLSRGVSLQRDTELSESSSLIISTMCTGGGRALGITTRDLGGAGDWRARPVASCPPDLSCLILSNCRGNPLEKALRCDLPCVERGQGDAY